MLVRIKQKVFYCIVLLKLINNGLDVQTAQIMAEQITYFKFKK